MADTVARLDRSQAAIPVAAVIFAAALIVNIWLLAALPLVASALGLAELIYGWRLRRRTVASFRTLATVAMVGGAVIAVTAAVLAVSHPVGQFGTDHHHTGTVKTG